MPKLKAKVLPDQQEAMYHASQPITSEPCTSKAQGFRRPTVKEPLLQHRPSPYRKVCRKIKGQITRVERSFRGAPR